MHGSSRPLDGTPLFLCSHMDTVPPTGPIEPVVEDGVVRNGAGTILGADNKSAVVAMVETARRVVEDRVPHAGLELLFTPKEEVGLKGAQAFDCSRFVARVGYVYDQAGPIGEVILGAPNSMIMKITFTGQAAHAGMAPEEGRSAIAAAARAIADMRLGRLDEETTANVGTVRGGVARNIVPESCVLDAEARSHDEAKLADLVQEMLDACSFAASLTGCEVEAEVNRGFHGYRFAKNDEPVRLAEGALRAQRVRADVHPLRRRRRREHLQHAGPCLPQPLERHGRDPYARGAHRRFRPGRDGRGHARAARGGPWRLASAEGP